VALIEVTVEDFLDGLGEDAREVRRVKFKLADKIEALELLGKHHRLYVERHEYDFREGIAERLALALADGPGQSADGEAGRIAGCLEAGLRAGQHERASAPGLDDAGHLRG
jgi:hypothetical protein